MKIQVTQEHIDNGLRNSCFSCPIALAINECNGITGAQVLLHEIRIRKDCNLYDVNCKTTKQIRDFMMLFDNGRKVEPFEFELDF